MPGDNSSRKKFISGKFIIKVLVTLALVGLICWHIDFRDFVRDLKLISTKTVIISSLLYTIGQIVSAVKWKIFLKRAGISRSFFALNHAYFLGMFINTFGLGTVGGDIARALLLKPEKSEQSGAFASVIADRIHGLAVLLIIGAVAVILVGPGVLGSFEPVIATLGILGTLICWFEWHRILQLAEKIFQSKKTILNKVLAFADNVALTFKLDNLDLIRATGLSTLMHFMHIYMYYIIALSLNVDINFSYLCVVVPIVNVASSLPISINGIGVRESLLILLLSQHLSSAGTTIAPETAVLIGILVTFIVTMVSGIGGVLCSMLKRS